MNVVCSLAGFLTLLLTLAGCGDDGPTPATAVATLTVTPTGPALDTLFSLGETVQLNVVARDANSNVVQGATISYSSANNLVASVNGSGRITAAGNGNTTVTISSGTVSEQRAVRVRQRLASLTASHTAIVLVPALAQPVTTQPRDARGIPIAGLTGVTFTSNNNNVATVSTAGVITGEAVGTTSVTASITTADGTQTADINVQVLASFPLAATINLLSDTFSPSEVILGVGGSVTFSNASGVEHNVTFTSGPAPANIGDHSSGQNGRTFATAGTVTFRCTIHSGMNGQVVVR